MRVFKLKFGFLVISLGLVGCASMGYDLENAIKFHNGSIDYSVNDVAEKIQNVEFKTATQCYHDVKIGKNMSSANGAGYGLYIPGTPQEKAVMKSQMQFAQDVWKVVGIREGGEKAFNNSKAGEVVSGIGKSLVDQFTLKNSAGLEAKRVNDCTAPVFKVLEGGV